jgi:hypothetical protein
MQDNDVFRSVHGPQLPRDTWPFPQLNATQTLSIPFMRPCHLYNVNSTNNLIDPTMLPFGRHREG